jgi:3-oxoacyl-(acyl-carrier-protein) synthase
MKPFAITGVGPVSPIGVGYDALLARLPELAASGEGLFHGERSVLREIPDPIAAEVWGFDPTVHLGDKGLRAFDRLTKFLLVASKLALEDAGLKRDGAHTVLAPERIGVCSATAYGSLDSITELVRVAELEDPRFLNPSRFPNTVINAAAGYVSIWQDLRAPNVTVVDGNCGALDAFLTSQTHLTTGRADAFLVGGGEVLSEPLYVAFRKLSALAEGERRYLPGSPDSEGMRLGEGGAYVILERDAEARARGARIRGRVLGYGNAFEPPDSEAILVHASVRSIERAVRAAIADAGITPADVDLVIGSLGGLAQFDVAELQALATVCGTEVPVLAPKRLYGETFGAAGVLGLVCGLAVLGGVPPGALLVRGRLGRPLETALVVTVGFYGNVSALVFSR